MHCVVMAIVVFFAIFSILSTHTAFGDRCDDVIRNCSI